MITGSFPNDALLVLNPIACIILGPIIQKWLYPFLAKKNIEFRPVARISAGFLFVAIGLAYAAGLQSWNYHTGPCYSYPLECAASANGTIPNQLSVWLQTPIYVILALAEIFCVVTGMIYAYSKAPKDMRSVVQAVGVLTAGVGATIGAGLGSLAKNPKLVALFAALAGVMGLTTVIFWVMFKDLDKVDEELNQAVIGREDAVDTSKADVKDKETKVTNLGARNKDVEGGEV